VRRARRILAGASAAAGFACLLLPEVAYADNCSGMSDCYYTARAALAALAGLSVLFGVLASMTLDLPPVVGTVKGVMEAFTGKDLVTGEELAWWERVLGIVPVLGGVAGAAGALSRGSRALDDAADLVRAADRASDVPWSGARYIEKVDPADARVYERIREAAGDTGRIADNTGIPKSRLDQIKEHVFHREHEVPVGPGQTTRGNFSPDSDIADLWPKATNGTLSPEEAERFRRLMAHEYVESRLMEQGLPYRSSHPRAYDADLVNRPTAQHHGAHDLAPHADASRDAFGHWDWLGRDHPGIDIAPDLSNLDDIVEIIMKGRG